MVELTIWQLIVLFVIAIAIGYLFKIIIDEFKGGNNMAISTHGCRDKIVKALQATCDNIKDDAEEIVGNIENVGAITVIITLKPQDAVTYEINRLKFTHFEEAD
jgi:small basic protein